MAQNRTTVRQESENLNIEQSETRRKKEFRIILLFSNTKRLDHDVKIVVNGV